MDAQTWAWLVFILGQTALVVALVRLSRAKDPRDSDGRKVPIDATRVAGATRMQAWAMGLWGACVLASSVIRVVDEPNQLGLVSVVLGIVAVAVVLVVLWSRRRATLRADDGARR